MARSLLVTESSGLIGSEVCVLGGGWANSYSSLEAFALAEQVSGEPMVYDYHDRNCEGDYICYISDLSRMKAHDPQKAIMKSLEQISKESYQSWVERKTVDVA